jgi:hypothetical protein
MIYQSILSLEYGDKLIDEVHLRFRDLYKNKLSNWGELFNSGPTVFTGFDGHFKGFDKA